VGAGSRRCWPTSGIACHRRRRHRPRHRAATTRARWSAPADGAWPAGGGPRCPRRWPPSG
jgi:hypothetical protein